MFEDFGDLDAAGRYPRFIIVRNGFFVCVCINSGIALGVLPGAPRWK